MRTLSDRAWHQVPVGDAVRFLDVELSTGQSAAVVRRRQKEFGPNRVTTRRRMPPVWIKFLQQFDQALVNILLLAVGAIPEGLPAAVTTAMHAPSRHSPQSP